jgi:hypothetical protein
VRQASTNDSPWLFRESQHLANLREAGLVTSTRRTVVVAPAQSGGVRASQAAGSQRQPSGPDNHEYHRDHHDKDQEAPEPAPPIALREEKTSRPQRDASPGRHALRRTG